MVRCEVCVDTVIGARIARNAGADRIELCTALDLGGLTPSAGLIDQAVATGITTHVLIRSRPGDFLYADDEIAVMEDDVRQAFSLGAASVVIGALTPDGNLDLSAIGRLVAAADGMPVALHRAFDVVADPLGTIAQLPELGIDRVLTSGQRASALQGAELLAELVRHAPDGVSVLAGGGIGPDNVTDLLDATALTEVHFSGRGRTVSAMVQANSAVRMGTVGDEESWTVTDADRVAATIAAVRAARPAEGRSYA